MHPENGWYLVTLENQNPDDNEVKQFNDWVECIDGKWDNTDYPKCKIVKIVKSEKDLTPK